MEYYCNVCKQTISEAEFEYPKKGLIVSAQIPQRALTLHLEP